MTDEFSGIDGDLTPALAFDKPFMATDETALVDQKPTRATSSSIMTNLNDQDFPLV